MTDRQHKLRLIIAAGVMTLALLGLIPRLLFLHLKLTADRRERVEDIRRLKKEMVVGRGKILDCNGHVLALDLVRKELIADPMIIHSNHQERVVCWTLAEILGTDPDVLMERLKPEHRRFVYLNGYGRHLNEEQAARIQALKFSGIRCEDVLARGYPRLSSACHVLGYVNLEREGCAGIERRWERYLRGVPGLLISELDGRRSEIYERRILSLEPRVGDDLILTLDQYIQYFTEQALEKVVREYSATAAWAIVGRVRTGEILAMASYPAFDPNQFRDVPEYALRNRCISDVYEPGSTFKIIAISAALNEKLVTPTQVFDCEGGVWLHRGKRLRDYHAYDKLSVADIVKKSSNIGTAKIAMILGEARFYQYLKAFGFGEATGIALPGEETGILHSLSQWRPISISRVAMGQGVAVTALQMLMAFSAIANDGTLMQPFIVREVRATDGSTAYCHQPRALSRPIRPAAAAEMKRLLARVTESGGTGTRAQVPGYAVGGKTGTAQKAVQGGYSDSLNVASFAGFLPVEKPELAIIVVVDEPKRVHTGGVVAAPVFREIAEQVVRYLDIPASETTSHALARR